MGGRDVSVGRRSFGSVSGRASGREIGCMRAAGERARLRIVEQASEWAGGHADGRLSGRAAAYANAPIYLAIDSRPFATSLNPPLLHRKQPCRIITLNYIYFLPPVRVL